MFILQSLDFIIVLLANTGATVLYISYASLLLTILLLFCINHWLKTD